MNKFLVVLLSIFVASSLAASVTLKNEDSHSHKLLLKSSETCFSGMHTSINSGTTSTQIAAGWACVDEKASC